jgi:hypothetical protein
MCFPSLVDYVVVVVVILNKKYYYFHDFSTSQIEFEVKKLIFKSPHLATLILFPHTSTFNTQPI